MEASSVGSSSAAVMNMLARNADEDVAKTATLLKKTMKADMDMVSKLLPVPVGGLDIQA
jgi:hypothetical protein